MIISKNNNKIFDTFCKLELANGMNNIDNIEIQSAALFASMYSLLDELISLSIYLKPELLLSDIKDYLEKAILRNYNIYNSNDDHIYYIWLDNICIIDYENGKFKNIPKNILNNKSSNTIKSELNNFYNDAKSNNIIFGQIMIMEVSLIKKGEPIGFFDSEGNIIHK